MKIIICLILFCICINSNANNHKDSTRNFKFDKLNIAQLNLGGQGVYYSLGYERIILNTKGLKILGNIAYSYYPQNMLRQTWLPLNISLVKSFGKHHAEIGVGRVYSSDYFFDKETMRYYKAFTVGYRHQSNNKKLMYKITYTPLIESFNPGGYHSLGGITLGYTF